MLWWIQMSYEYFLHLHDDHVSGMSSTCVKTLPSGSTPCEISKLRGKTAAADFPEGCIRQNDFVESEHRKRQAHKTNNPNAFVMKLRIYKQNDLVSH